MSAGERMTGLCDACLAPLAAHLPSDLAECAQYDPWGCAGCGDRLPDDPAERQADMCHSCAERRYDEMTRRFEWVAP